MVKLIVLFRAGKHAPDYEERYNNFLMLLEKLPGIRKKVVSNVYSGPGGLVPFRDVIEVLFDDRAALEKALSSPIGIKSGEALLAFAGPDAVTLFAETMEEVFETDSSA